MKLNEDYIFKFIINFLGIFRFFEIQVCKLFFCKMDKKLGKKYLNILLI